MKHIVTLHVPVKSAIINAIVHTKELALEHLEELKTLYNVVSSEWIDGDLVIKVEVEIKEEE